MNNTVVNHGHKALTVKVAVAALLAACVALVMGAANAKAATVGDPINADFNYAGIYVELKALGEVDQLLDSTAEPIGLSGQYTSADGDFSVPKAGGLAFPTIAVPVGPASIDGDIKMVDDATGHYDSATGQMDLDLKISLTLGVSDIAALPEEVKILLGNGSGPLTCTFAPIEISLSTTKGWPHAGKNFADKANLTDGALAGAWRSTPDVTQTAGPPGVCDLIAGFLEPVGGIWLANSSTTIDEDNWPAPFDSKPSPPNCKELGKIGTYPDCQEEPKVCPEGQTGTPPNCQDIVEPPLPGKLGALKVTKKVTVKAGKKAKIKITVKNTGGSTLNTKVTLKSNKKTVKVQKSVSVKVAAGKSVTKTIVVKTTKKAKGKATITAKASGKTAKATVTVKAAKKKKRR